MAIILARGWECGNTMLNTVDVNAGAGTVAASTNMPKTGSYSLEFAKTSAGAATQTARWSLGSTEANVSLSAWILHRASNSNPYNNTDSVRLGFTLDSGDAVEMRWNGATHTMDAYVAGVLVAPGTVEVSVQDWFHVQMTAEIADVGSIVVLIDGHPSINYSGDTKPGVATGATYLHTRVYHPSTGYVYIDDLVGDDAGTLLGDLRVYDKRPSGDDATAQWTPSTGAVNYAMEDATPNNDAEYNQAATNGLIDQFALSALDVTGFTVAAVQAWSRAKMTDGVGDSIDVGINSGGTANVARSTLSTSWEYYFGNVAMVDPADLAAWNQAKLDALLHRKVSVIT